MVGKSAKKSNTTKTHSNGNYEVGGMVFPSYHLFDVLKEINKNLSYFYTPGGEETDYCPIFDSPIRHSDEFDDLYKNIKYINFLHFLVQYMMLFLKQCLVVIILITQ